MKRAFFFIATAMLGIIYHAAGRPMEIADRVMVNAFGIDRTAEGYQVTMQIFTPAGGGSETAVDPTQPNVSLAKGRGASVADAVHECESELGGHVFIGQNRIIVFGRSVDLSETDEVFGYFLSMSDAYLNTDCAAAEDTAEKLLSVPVGASGVTSERFIMMIDSESESGCSVKCSLMQLLEAMETPHRCAVLPEFTEVRDKKSGGSGGKEKKLSDNSLIRLDKGAVFRDGVFFTEISGEEHGLIGLLNGIGKAVFTEAEYGGKKLGISYRISAREVSASQEGGELRVKLSCTAEPLGGQYFSGSRERSGFNEAAFGELTRETEELAEKLFDMGLPELAGADKALRRYFPGQLRKDGFSEELFGRLSYEIEIK